MNAAVRRRHGPLSSSSSSNSISSYAEYYLRHSSLILHCSQHSYWQICVCSLQSKWPIPSLQKSLVFLDRDGTTKLIDTQNVAFKYRFSFLSASSSTPITTILTGHLRRIKHLLAYLLTQNASHHHHHHHHHNRPGQHHLQCHKEITLSLRRPRDAPNMWVPWKL